MTRLVLAAALLVLQSTGAASQVHLLIVSGLGGEPRYVEEFHQWGTTMVDAAVDRLAIPPENVIYLAEDPARDELRIDGTSRRDEIGSALLSMAERAAPDDRVMVLLIGHGSADSRGSRINLPGPDLTAEELAELLTPFETQPLVVVNTASASGDFHEPLAGENRTIITATRSGMERNETLFGEYFVAAFAEEGADVDQDGRVTIAEAYEFAETETERAYTNDNRLQLEHSRMEGDLELAAVFHLGGTAVATVPADASPELRALYEERQRLQSEVDALRIRSTQLDAAEYQRQLETLLLDLARTNREIQEAGGSQ
ncbi:MAG: C13 family peptidase [Gemmatimonadota bacterium]